MGMPRDNVSNQQTTDLRQSMANLQAFSKKTDSLLVSSIKITAPVLTDPATLINTLNGMNEPGEFHAWASSFETIIKIRAKEYAIEKIRIHMNKNARWDQVINGYITADRQLKIYFDRLQEWLTAEKNIVESMRELILAVKESISAYIARKSRKNSDPKELIEMTRHKFGSVSTITISPDGQNITHKTPKELIENPRLFMQTVMNLPEKFKIETTINSDSLTILMEKLAKHDFTNNDKRRTLTLINAANFRQRKQELQDLCIRIIGTIDTLKMEKEKIDEYESFENNILSVTIDALKYRRERTWSKINNFFANAELCKLRVELLDYYIGRLENGDCKNVLELNVMLMELKLANASKTLPFRFVDKLGGLNKLLVAHTADDGNFNMFKEPARKHRRNVGGG